MKISEMIAEEMVRGIYPNKISTIVQITDKRIDYYDNQYVPNACSIDLARFLFVDAWDYFNKKGWYIEMYTRIIRVSKDDIEWRTVVITDYPSKLHAMADIIKYMWEQKEKNDGK